MTTATTRAITQLLAATLVAAVARPMYGQATMSWPIHSTSRPQPAVVDPGPFTASTPPPSDAIVLFNGQSLDNWRSGDNGDKPARWRVQDDYMEVVAGAGAVATAQAFGDVQLHVEWMAPRPASGEGQDRGNSGVFLMGRYEVQVLDSYRSQTYPDGQAGAIYGQYPPLVNASRPPGEWQSYDIVFLRPRFGAAGRVVRPARVTVFHNSVLVQNDVTLTGPTAHQRRPPYSAHADALPFTLQDHGHPVRYRNIWVRPLREPAG
jgi:3-keto-disaccharide hydrolase